VKGLPIGALVSVAFGAGLAPASGLAQAPTGRPVAILEYPVAASATWGPSPGAPPTFALGRPVQVLRVIPGGYVVREEVPLEGAIQYARDVSRQLGYPVLVTIPDPAGGPPRVESVGTGDVGK
jgi:hypothetical protein